MQGAETDKAQGGEGTKVTTDMSWEDEQVVIWLLLVGLVLLLLSPILWAYIQRAVKV